VFSALALHTIPPGKGVLVSVTLKVREIGLPAFFLEEEEEDALLIPE
jgi:hypothetical protein